MADEGAISQMAGGLRQITESLITAGVAVHGMNDAVKGFTKVLEAPTKALSGFAKVLQGSAKDAKDGFLNFTVALSRWSTKAGDALFNMGQRVEKTLPVLNALSGVFSTVTSVLSTVISGLGGVAGGILQLGLSGLGGGLQVFGDIIKLLSSVIVSSFGPAIDLFLAGLLTLADVLAGPMQDSAINFINNGLDKAVETINSWITSVNGWITNIGDIGSKFVATIDWLITSIKELIKFVVTFGPMLVGAWAGSIFGPLGAAAGALAGLLVSIVNRFAGGGDKSKMSDHDRLEATQKEVASARRAAGFKSNPELEGEIARGRMGREKAEEDAAKQKPGAGGPNFKLPTIPKVQIDKRALDELQVKNLERVINARELEVAKAGNIGYSGITDVQKQVQMNAIQNDIQGETLQVQIQQLENSRMMLQLMKERLAAGTKK